MEKHFPMKQRTIGRLFVVKLRMKAKFSGKQKTERFGLNFELSLKSVKKFNFFIVYYLLRALYMNTC